MIEIRHLKKVYELGTPLKDLSVDIHDGDVISIIGPSGCGKSTLLRCINLLETPTVGQIFLNGEEITAKGYDKTKARRKIGMVFQSFNLFPNLTVVENIMKPQVDILKRNRQEAYDRALEYLKKVGLAERKFSYPDELSGGQKQRVAIARTLAMDPEVILFDEPTSALDPAMVDEVRSVILDLAKSGRTMMIVTHDMEFAQSAANRVFYLDEGGLYEEGTPEKIFEHPEREKTRIFVRQLRCLELDITSKDFDFRAMAYSISEYCYRNQFTRKMSNSVNLVFEELAGQLILPRLDKEGRTRVSIEYSRKTGTIGMSVRYSGIKFDPFESDSLSKTLIEGLIKEYRYEESEGEYPNLISIDF